MAVAASAGAAAGAGVGAVADASASAAVYAEETHSTALARPAWPCGRNVEQSSVAWTR